MNLQSCPNIITLNAFAAGELTGDSSDEVSRHVDGCAKCRGTVEEFNASFLATLGSVRNETVEHTVASSPQAMRFVPGQNRTNLSSDFRAIADSFAAARLAGTNIDIERHLATHGIKSVSTDLTVEHVMVLLELLHFELQYAWKLEAAAPAIGDAVNGSADAIQDFIDRPTTDQFVRRFPILRSCPLLVADLAKQEAAIRGFEIDDNRANEAGQSSGLEQFDLIEPIAAGEMGVVWRALNRELGRIVAVKLIQQNKTVGNQDRQLLYEQRFLVEAAADVIASSPQELAAWLKAELVRWGKVIKDAGIRAS